MPLELPDSDWLELSSDDELPGKHQLQSHLFTTSLLTDGASGQCQHVAGVVEERHSNVVAFSQAGTVALEGSGQLKSYHWA